MKQNFYHKNWQKRGFTLIELVASLAIFAILTLGVLGALQSLFQTVKAAREQSIISTLASQRLEIARNLPYDEVGTAAGNPAGQLPDAASPFSTTIEGKQYQVYYEVTFQDDPADGTVLLGTDSVPADYKQIKMFVKNVTSGKVSSFLTTISPQGLEGADNSGALYVSVINAVGEVVPSVNVHIENLSANPQIILDRQTDVNGKWVEVGLPAGVNAYHITVSKTGYSSDQTYPATAQNPNPIKPDATIVFGKVTQVSFAIDLVAALNIRTLNETCQAISGVGINLKGTKLIGLSPDVLKFDNNYTSTGGAVSLNTLEWDTYIPTLLANQSYVLLGSSPIQQISVLPGSTNVFTLILASASTPNSLLVIVKDAATGAALQGATVHLREGGSVPQDYSGTTGGSVWTQSDWTGGPGQVAWSDETKYDTDNGSVDSNSNPTGLRLRKVSSDYLSPGILESSVYDTGTDLSNYTSINWLPTSQDKAAEVKFQIASSNSSTGPWNYFGPDGTNSTYYTVSGSAISSAHDNNRYVRYKVFFSTTNNKKTPVITSLVLNYVSGCYTPGQVAFYDLTSGNNYDLDVSLAGYQTYIENNMTINGQNVLEVLLSP